MARLFPFSSEVASLLEKGPTAGNTHQWLGRIASNLAPYASREKLFKFLREVMDSYVEHRAVPDREIEGALDFAYSDKPASQRATRIDWPDFKPHYLAHITQQVQPLFNCRVSTGLNPSQVLPTLFAPKDWVCTGKDKLRAMIRPMDSVSLDAHLLQYIVPNPMRGPIGVPNQRNWPALRCQANVAFRRFIVCEFDLKGVTKELQAQALSFLARQAPLVLVVDSGGKSLHGWFYVVKLPARDRARLFATGTSLGADRTLWNHCGWARMPGGLRPVDAHFSRQLILYHNPSVICSLMDTH